MSELAVGQYIEVWHHNDLRAPYRTGIIDEVTDTCVWVNLSDGSLYPADRTEGTNLFKVNEETALFKVARLDQGNCNHDPRYDIPDGCVTCIARTTLKEIGWFDGKDDKDTEGSQRGAKEQTAGDTQT